MSDITSADERGLILEFLRGDLAALRTIDGWIEMALRDGFQSLRGEWDDLKQEIRIRVFRNLSRSCFDGRSSLRTYVHRIAKNVAIDTTRRARHAREGREESRELPLATQESGLHRWMNRDLLIKVLDGLSEADRRLIVMVFTEHSSYAEVARRLGITEGAVKTRMSRCKDRLVERARRIVDIEEGSK